MRGPAGRKALLTLLIITSVALAGGLGFKTVLGHKQPDDRVIQVSAKNFEFTPNEIKVKKGETIVLEFKSEDRTHGFSLPDFKVSTKIKPGASSQVRFTADKVGTFPFSCNVFCGSGHEDMTGTIVVTE